MAGKSAIMCVWRSGGGVSCYYTRLLPPLVARGIMHVCRRWRVAAVQRKTKNGAAKPNGVA